MKSKLSLEGRVSAAALRATALAGLAVSLSACVTQVGVEGSDAGYDESGYVEAQAREAPPPLPDYEQPPCPEDGYLWTPGYWGWSGAGYYWVPGTWVQPPRMGVLWTPGYWAFAGGAYAFHAGYWSPHVGYYGGINYGYGYPGRGFVGGGWHGNRYSYNRDVDHGRGNRASYNGGAGGTAAAPTGEDRHFWRESHGAPTPMQQQHIRQAAQNPEFFARANGGHPAIAATPRPAAFNAPGVVGARGAGPQIGGRAQPPAESQPQFRGRGLNQNQPATQLQAPQGPQAAQTEPQPQYQGRGRFPNQQSARGQGAQAPQVQSQPQFQGRGSRPDQPAVQSPTPNQAPPLAPRPSPLQRPAQNHEPRHERDGEREKPHPKKRDDNDPSGR